MVEGLWVKANEQEEQLGYYADPRPNIKQLKKDFLYMEDECFKLRNVCKNLIKQNAYYKGIVLSLLRKVDSIDKKLQGKVKELQI